MVDEAHAGAAQRRTPGPTFVDFPLDQVFMEAAEPTTLDVAARAAARHPAPTRARSSAPWRCSRDAERPGDHGRDRPLLGPRRGRAPRARRGAPGPRVPQRPGARLRCRADHELFFSARAGRRSAQADVALVIGVPLDFRLGFGAAFAQDAEIVVIDVAEPERDHPRPVAAELYGALPATLEALPPRRGAGAARRARGWIASLRAIERREARGGGGRAGRSARAASPDADLRRAGRSCSTATRS